MYRRSLPALVGRFSSRSLQRWTVSPGKTFVRHSITGQAFIGSPSLHSPSKQHPGDCRHTQKHSTARLGESLLSADAHGKPTLILKSFRFERYNGRREMGYSQPSGAGALRTVGLRRDAMAVGDRWMTVVVSDVLSLLRAKHEQLPHPPSPYRRKSSGAIITQLAS